MQPGGFPGRKAGEQPGLAKSGSIRAERSGAGPKADQGEATTNTDSDRVFPLDPDRGVLGKFDRALQVELLLNLLAVVLDGLDAQMQFLRDFLGLLPLPDELEHFHLPVTEPLDRRRFDRLLPADLLGTLMS